MTTSHAIRNRRAALASVSVALLLGLLVFRQRVRGAYFAVLSQALAAAFVILLVRQQGLTGRSYERRVANECLLRCRPGWTP